MTVGCCVPAIGRGLLPLVVVLGLALWSLTARPVLAAETVAQVVALRGGVEVERADGRTPLKVKDLLYVTDTIHTNDGRVQIMFTDHSLITLGRETVLSISEYRYHPGDNDATLKTRVKEGVFRVVGGAVTKLAPQKFTTETPTATIGVRGSMYAGRYQNGQLTVLFEGGVGVYVTNAMGTVELTTANLLTTVSEGQGPTPPKPATPSEIQGLYQALTPVAGEAKGGQGPSAAEGTDTTPATPAGGSASAGGVGQGGELVNDALSAASQQKATTEATAQAKGQTGNAASLGASTSSPAAPPAVGHEIDLPPQPGVGPTVISPPPSPPSDGPGGGYQPTGTTGGNPPLPVRSPKP